MYCPNCAKSASTDQKFCRSCGFNLERTAELLSEQLSGDPAFELRRQEQSLEKFGNVVFTAFGVVMALGAVAFIYLVLTRMVLSGTQPLVGLLVAAIILFAVPSLAYVFWRESLKDKRANLALMQQIEKGPTSNTSQLGDGSDFTPAQSVVEPTTELLVENKVGKFALHADD